MLNRIRSQRSNLQLGRDRSFRFAARRSSRGVPGASLPEVFQVASAASKNVEFCFSNIGNTYGVSRTRQAAFTVSAVLPQSPGLARRRYTPFLGVICDP